MNKDDWKVVYVSTEEEGEGYAEQMIDDEVNTYWHSQWQGAQPLHPHRVIIDLGEIRTVKGFRIRQRNPESAGCVKDFRLYGRPQFFLFK